MHATSSSHLLSVPETPDLSDIILVKETEDSNGYDSDLTELTSDMYW